MKFFNYLLVDFQFNCIVVREHPLYDFNTLKFDEIAWIKFYILCSLGKVCVSCRCWMQGSVQFHWVKVVNTVVEIYVLTIFICLFYQFLREVCLKSLAVVDLSVSSGGSFNFSYIQRGHLIRCMTNLNHCVFSEANLVLSCSNQPSWILVRLSCVKVCFLW